MDFFHDCQDGREDRGGQEEEEEIARIFGLIAQTLKDFGHTLTEAGGQKRDEEEPQDHS